MPPAFLFLLACSESGTVAAPEDTESPGVAPSTEWSYPPGEDLPLESTAAQFEEALPGIWETLVGVDATPIFDAYAAVMAYEEEGCPAYTSEDPYDIWQQHPSCTSARGATFFGEAYTGANGHAVGRFSSTFLMLMARVEWEDGRLFVGNGSAEQFATQVRGTEATTGSLRLEGDFAWNGQEAEGTWLATGLRPSVNVETSYDPESGQRSYAATAAWSGGEGPFTAVSLLGMSLADDGAGTCTSEPTGTVAVRDANGNWLELALDGGAITDTPACDACGVVTWQGTELGAACTDLSALLAWEGAPW